MNSKGEAGLPAGESGSWALIDLQRIRVVMVETSLAANIGAAARAMKTMGVGKLYLVNPGEAPDEPTATARASGAQDILEAAWVTDSLDAALAGTTLVLGTSARSRNLPWPMLEPERMGAEIARYATHRNDDIALVFGRERSGLSNEELARCHFHVQIPANPDYSSLNIAAAVQVLCYELRRAALAGTDATEPAVELARPEDMTGFLTHLEEMLVDIGFADPNNQRQLMLKLRRYFMRSQPEPTELNILRGIVSQAQKQARR